MLPVPVQSCTQHSVCSTVPPHLSFSFSLSLSLSLSPVVKPLTSFSLCRAFLLECFENALSYEEATERSDVLENTNMEALVVELKDTVRVQENQIEQLQQQVRALVQLTKVLATNSGVRVPEELQVPPPPPSNHSPLVKRLVGSKSTSGF